MRFIPRCLLVLSAGLITAGCGDDKTTDPQFTFGPPGTTSMVTGSTTVRLAWGASSFEGSSDFGGYNVYVDEVPIAANDDAGFLAARLVNTSPISATTFTVSSTASSGSLQQGTRYYFHVRTRRLNGDLSDASNEVETSPRPEGTNGADPSQYMYDDAGLTQTKSGYGWNVLTGQGVAYSATALNDSLVDVLMAEEPNSPDDGSLILSPAAADFTIGWARRNHTLFKDLGAGDAAWQIAVAPEPSSMAESVKIQADHTYAIRTHDGHWTKLRVTDLVKNVDVALDGGGTAQLNYARFTYAVQLIGGFGRF